MHRLEPLGGALNAYTLRFDPALLAPIQQSYLQQLQAWLQAPEQAYLLEGGHYHNLGLGAYHLVSYDTAPLLWLSSNRPETYALFRNFFAALNIESEIRGLVDTARRIVMYCGFLVVGDRAEEPIWHYDYRPGAHAYTLITPLFEWNPVHGHLLYKGSGSLSETYTYRLGEAIVFGEGFLHSTAPYESCGKIRVLLSLTFGTDKWKYWDILKENIQEQSEYFLQPCGHAIGTCRCRARYLLGRKLRDFFRP